MLVYSSGSLDTTTPYWYCIQLSREQNIFVYMAFCLSKERNGQQCTYWYYMMYSIMHATVQLGPIRYLVPWYILRCTMHERLPDFTYTWYTLFFLRGPQGSPENTLPWETPREIHEKPVGDLWRTQWKPMGNPWETHRRSMDHPWQTHERPMADPWEAYGSSMGDIWETHGRPVGDLWGTHGRPTGDLWEALNTHGGPVSDLWATYG